MTGNCPSATHSEGEPGIEPLREPWNNWSPAEVWVKAVAQNQHADGYMATVHLLGFWGNGANDKRGKYREQNLTSSENI